MKNPQDVTPAEYEFGGESAGAEQEQGESGKWRYVAVLIIRKVVKKEG